jgi:tetratricopeptide (TPR) repeat protein
LALAQYHGGHDDVDEALRHLNRLESGHPNAKDIRAEAQLYRGRLLERHDRWGEALEVFRSLPIDHPLSEAALWSHLEIAGHYERTGNAEGMQSALRDAENAFRGVVDRYPSETLTLSAREKLAQVLMIQERYGEAVEELTGLATALRGTLRGARQLAMAAQVYELKLEDGARALELYRRAVDWYPGTEFASAAAEAADRLSEETDR